MLGKIESERKRERPRIRGLDGITDSMDIILRGGGGNTAWLIFTEKQMSSTLHANRWGNSGNSVRLYFFGLQNHCRW